MVEADRVLLARNHVVEGDLQGSARACQELTEVGDHSVPTSFDARQAAATRHVPDGVFGEHRRQGPHVALGEGLIRAT